MSNRAPTAGSDEQAPNTGRTVTLVVIVASLLLLAGGLAAWAAWQNPQSTLPTPTPHQLPGAEDVRPMPGD